MEKYFSKTLQNAFKNTVPTKDLFKSMGTLLKPWFAYSNQYTKKMFTITTKKTWSIFFRLHIIDKLLNNT